GGLDVTQRFGRDPDVSPGGRDPERADAVQRPGLGDLCARRVAVPEAVPVPGPGQAGAVRIDADQLGNRSRARRRLGAHNDRAYAVAARSRPGLAAEADRAVGVHGPAWVVRDLPRVPV